MPKSLPLKDFRARRIVLTRSDFAYAPGPALRPSDVIDKATWRSITVLPDDVAIRTSNHHGTALEQLHDLFGAWIECFGNTQDCMQPVILDASDDLQAATYNALVGYYRLSIAALRSALEIVTIGAWGETRGKSKEFVHWRNGRYAASFGMACDGLIRAADSLEAGLRTAVKDSLFDQRTPQSEGGFARRLYDGISDFAHSRPGSTDSDMRESNGPIYVRSAFNHVAWMQFETLGLCFVLLLLARPKTSLPSAAIDLFRDAERLKSRVTRAAFEILHRSR